MLVATERQTIPLQTPFAVQTTEPEMVFATGREIWITAIGGTFARLQGQQEQILVASDIKDRVRTIFIGSGNIGGDLEDNVIVDQGLGGRSRRGPAGRGSSATAITTSSCITFSMTAICSMCLYALLRTFFNPLGYNHVVTPDDDCSWSLDIYFIKLSFEVFHIQVAIVYMSICRPKSHETRGRADRARCIAETPCPITTSIGITH